jgi:uncharacterized protein involved in exopolysaccharide biosynthesis
VENCVLHTIYFINSGFLRFITQTFLQSASKEQIKTQYELLKSRKFAERVIVSLNLIEHQEFNRGKYNDKISFFANMGKGVLSQP